MRRTYLNKSNVSLYRSSRISHCGSSSIIKPNRPTSINIKADQQKQDI